MSILTLPLGQGLYFRLAKSRYCVVLRTSGAVALQRVGCSTAAETAEASSPLRLAYRGAQGFRASCPTEQKLGEKDMNGVIVSRNEVKHGKQNREDQKRFNDV
jgi:hypothetical protein